jgi:hypothetical protein
MKSSTARINWAFVPLLIFIAIRGYLQDGWLYAVAVIGAGLLLGLFLRRRVQKKDLQFPGTRDSSARGHPDRGRRG